MLRRSLAGLLLVGIGLALSPDAVPVYDGIGAPDEPYRFVATPGASPSTAPPTEAVQTTPVVKGVTRNGMTVATAEQGPQFSMYLPPKALATTKGPVQVKAVPEAPTDAPAGTRVDGNVYLVTVTGPAPLTRTSASAIATVYLRATTSRQPGPTMYHRAEPTGVWEPLRTSRGGTDFYAAVYSGPGQYVLAFDASGASGGGFPVALVSLGGVVLLVVVVVVIRLRDASRRSEPRARGATGEL
jgi:hypothetical protein